MFKKRIAMTAMAIILSNGVSSWAAETIIAKVNGEPIHASELQKVEKTLHPDIVKKEKEKDKDKFFTHLRDQAIDLKLLKNAANNANLEKDAEVQKALEQVKEQVILQAFVGKQLEPLVNDKTIKAKYDEFIKSFPKDDMETEVSHVLLKDKSEAEKVIQDLKGGADFKKVAREKSIDKATASEGGNLGFIRKGDVNPAFGEAAFTLKPGTYSDKPIQTSLGWHVIKVSDRRKVKPPKFEDVKEALGTMVFQEQLKKMVEQLRDKASIERFNAQGLPATSDTPSAPDSNPKDAAIVTNKP